MENSDTQPTLQYRWPSQYYLYQNPSQSAFAPWPQKYQLYQGDLPSAAASDGKDLTDDGKEKKNKKDAGVTPKKR